jgi:Tol biopolymer transport system component
MVTSRRGAYALALAVLLCAWLLAGCGPTPEPTEIAGPTEPPKPSLVPLTELPPAEPLPTMTETPTPLPTPTPVPLVRSPTDTPQPTPPPTAPPPPQPTPPPTASPTEPPVPDTVTPVMGEGGQPLATPTEVPTEAPPPSALSGRIAFPIFDPDRATYDIGIQDLDSGKREWVFFNASQPDFDSKGGRIAYVSWEDGRRGAYAHTIGGGWWALDTHVEAARPSWSPDDEIIVFVSTEGSPERKAGIYRMVLLDYYPVYAVQDSGQFGPLVGDFPCWLADNERIVYAARGCSRCGLYTVRIFDKQPRAKQITTELTDIAPEGSPDGEQIAFMSLRDGNWEIYLVNAEGGGLTRLTKNEVQDGLPAWSPNGQSIAFVSDRDGAWAVWVMNRDGSNQRKLFDIGGTIDGAVGIDPRNSYGWTQERISWTDK